MLLGILRQVLVVLILGAPFFVFERIFAAHRVSYRKHVARDVAALLVVVLAGIVSTALMNALLPPASSIVAVLPRAPELPLWVSVPAAVVAADFAFYWIHRAIHTRVLWGIHRWHHSPRHMYWLAGVRASLLQGVLYSIFPLVFIMLGVPPSITAAYAIVSVVCDHWMHANVRLRAPMLEMVLVTPRFHHVHHSRDPRHHGRNLGSLLSVWDRMFGTYFDPDDVRAPLEFGIDDAVSAPRLVVGL
jgi:sterol desaturase/sphingolipid hydroxylase (fatty acid hydroxylase superfamily)